MLVPRNDLEGALGGGSGGGQSEVRLNRLVHLGVESGRVENHSVRNSDQQRCAAESKWGMGDVHSGEAVSLRQGLG